MSMLRSQWGAAPWHRPASFAADKVAPPAKSPAAPDVAIVGGGLTGASAAYHLAKIGIHAMLFEAGFIGDGASGRTGGLVLEGTAAGILNQVDACVPGLNRLVDQEEIDCGLVLPGCWEIEHRKAAPARMLPWSDDGRPASIARTVNGGAVQPAALTIGIARDAVRSSVSSHRLRESFSDPSYRWKSAARKSGRDISSSPPMRGSMRRCPTVRRCTAP